MDTVSETRTESQPDALQEQPSEAAPASGGPVQERASEGQGEAQRPAQEPPDIARLIESLPEPEWRRIPKLQSVLDKAAEAERLRRELQSIQQQQRELDERRRREETVAQRKRLRDMEPEEKAAYLDNLLQEQELQDRLQEQIDKARKEVLDQINTSYNQGFAKAAEKLGLTTQELQQLAERSGGQFETFIEGLVGEVSERRASKRADELAAKRAEALLNDRRAERDGASRGPLTTEPTGPGRVDFSRMSEEEFARYAREHDADPTAFIRRYNRALQ